ncbi:MAG: sarcosine oxidase subunit beta family protein [Rhodospirillum sp.]|nr:sarcosine oxidase subunit beta family protein [Rhodospirillum sp.]MCF8490516.1 sarcosine oxidase subunit beta family protein [Rhodospirillum sp.]
MRHSFFSLIRNALGHHREWPPLWRDPDPKAAYDVIIIGGGGHGLATAYYLAKEQGLGRIAVVEKGWIGGGNSARNTTIVRSNYLWDASAHLYEHSLRIWEGLSRELNFNVMFSQRGVLNLAHSLHDVRDAHRRIRANDLNGIDAEWLDPTKLASYCPLLDISPEARYPILGATLQRRGGTARHDAVVWGFARAADRLGVDILQHCEVTGIPREGGKVTGVETTRGVIKAPKVAIVAAGHAGTLAAMAGFRLPLVSHPLQALVSEPMKPLLDCVVMSNAVHVYVSQSDKGELVIGAGIDPYAGYAQKGSFSIITEQMGALVSLFPRFSRLRMMRSWGGIVDTAPDASPIIGKSPVEGLYLNCGWGTGGFKATPGSGQVFAQTIARDAPHPLVVPFTLDRFTTGALVDEHGAAGVAH